MTEVVFRKWRGPRFAAALLAAASCYPHMAFAQQSDSATIDATATLSKAPPVLTLKPTDTLRFGTVQIHPLESGHCTYGVLPDGALMVEENGKPVANNANCQYLDTLQGAGRLIVNCEAGLSVRFAVSPTSTSGDPSATFSSDSTLISTDGSVSDVAKCKNDGTIDVALGGQLFVLGTAKPIDSETVIGRILLDVAYDDGTGCEYC